MQEQHLDRREEPTRQRAHVYASLSQVIRSSAHARRIKRSAIRTVERIRDFGYRIPVSALRPAAPQAAPVVALTSFPARISRVALVIESIQRQTVRPQRIVLVLASSQFPDGRLPWSLRLQLSRPNVELLWVEEDTRSYKKLAPVRSRYPDDTVITIDDDVVYRRSLLADLTAAAARWPASIIGNRGWELGLDAGKLEPYASAVPAGPDSPQERVLLTGVGGILYPPEAFPADLLSDPVAQQICPTADDIWFWAIARTMGIQTICLGKDDSKVYREIVALKSGPSLQEINNGLGHNDGQIMGAIRHFNLESVIGLEVKEN